MCWKPKGMSSGKAEACCTEDLRGQQDCPDVLPPHPSGLLAGRSSEPGCLLAPGLLLQSLPLCLHSCEPQQAGPFWKLPPDLQGLHKAHSMVWGGPTRYLPSPLPVPSSPLLKGSDRSPGPGLTPSPQPSCSCRLSKPGAAEVLRRCLRVSQGEEARCARQSWAQAGSWAGGPRPSPLCELPSVCSFVQHPHPSPGLRGARSSEPACLPAPSTG